MDRGRLGSKQHLLVDGGGLPLAWALTDGNRNDVTQLLALLDRVPPVHGRVGRPRRSHIQSNPATFSHNRRLP